MNCLWQAGKNVGERCNSRKHTLLQTHAQECKDAQGAEANAPPTAAEAQASAARSVRHLARKHKRDYPDAAATRVRQVCVA